MWRLSCSSQIHNVCPVVDKLKQTLIVPIAKFLKRKKIRGFHQSHLQTKDTNYSDLALMN
jgi:hypothetical protein